MSTKYSEYVFWFAFLIVLDIGSHWFHMASTVANGHHKSAKTLQNRNFVLRWYYGVYPFFAFCCVGQEFFYIYLYVTKFIKHTNSFLYCILIIACVLKQIVNLFQLMSAVMTFASQDAEQRNKRK